MRKHLVQAAALLATTLLANAAAHAQSAVLTLPDASQAASVGQRVGLTDITVTYHRPLVRGRNIWGDLVPFGQVWRAGADENTTIAFSDDVTVEGQPLAKGTYGLHMLPEKDGWTVIFSKNHTSWGSFSYDKAEDALRVPVKPVPSEPHEALTYDFDQLTPDSVTVTLRWEKLAVPFKVAVDVKAITVARLKEQLRTKPSFTWIGWNDAANWCVKEKTNLDGALKWADTSIQNEERFENLDTKSLILAALGKPAEAKVAMDRALSKAGPLQMHGYARRLLGEKKVDEAIKIFETNAKKHPDIWFVHAGLARAQSAKGNYAAAAKSMKEALSRAPEDQKTYIKGLVDKLEAGKDINS